MYERARLVVAALALALAAMGCSDTERPSPPAASGPEASNAEPPSAPTATAEPTPQARAVRPADLDAAVAMAAVRHLAGEIGPRHATSPAYRAAADWVARRFSSLGYDVRRQPVAVPGGDSWGVPVDAGRSENVIASPNGLDPAAPHLLVGAHLDTVPQAPGAEDNASGVGVLLAVAEAIADRRTRLPVVLVAFGAEEPRGPTDADHHYGSRAYVASFGPAQRRAVRGMLSLDRVGVGSVVPVGQARSGPDPAHRAVLAAARRAGVPVRPDLNRSSDHWQFVLGGMPGVRLGSTPYAAYHSPDDVPAVVDQAQLARTGRLVLAWLAR
ncbi:M28 family metallopeptidase [Nocardioides speluncae]|uniref:M28 family metallopeptidase n=1 Tax=Nocardioides speluncae TaxID=2670337 RepID=UPI001F0C4CEF|nr:M28 family peptidase [Nocardioides speluncae]